MKLQKLEKVKDGKYLKNYILTYLNKENKEKKYEIVSRSNLETPEDLGKSSSGVSIVVTKGDKLLLLKEFRMGINQEIYNLVAGMLEKGESIEDCIKRELYEETGLTLKRIQTILPLLLRQLQYRIPRHISPLWKRKENCPTILPQMNRLRQTFIPKTR